MTKTVWNFIESVTNNFLKFTCVIWKSLLSGKYLPVSPLAHWLTGLLVFWLNGTLSVHQNSWFLDLWIFGFCLSILWLCSSAVLCTYWLCTSGFAAQPKMINRIPLERTFLWLLIIFWKIDEFYPTFSNCSVEWSQLHSVPGVVRNE